MTTEPDLSPLTGAAVAAVRTAMPLAASGVGDPANVTSKGVRDLVTRTDVAIEDTLRAAAAEAGVAFVGEERGGRAPDDAPYWLVDPLCGTTNFAMGIPLSCVNVAVVDGGAVVASVVGDLSTGDLLVAERGGGAWARRDDRWRRLATSDTSATVVIEAGRSTGARRDAAARCVAAAIRADRWDVLALSSTVSLAYVAAGRVAAYLLFPAAPLHLAAGTLLATEAGGVVTDLAGAPWTLASDSLVASAHPALHDDLLALAAESAGGP